MASFASSYIPTLASAVTRSADVASVNTLSPWFNATEGTLFAEFDFIGRNPASPGDAQGILSLSDNVTAPSNSFGLFGYGDGTAKRYALCFSGGSLQALLVGTDSAVNTAYKSAARYKANDFALVNGGGAAITDTSGSVPSGVDRLLLGRLYTTSDTPLNGHLRRAAYYPRTLTTAEMQSLTS